MNQKQLQRHAMWLESEHTLPFSGIPTNTALAARALLAALDVVEAAEAQKDHSPRLRAAIVAFRKLVPKETTT